MLGKGTYGESYQVVHETSNRVFALKRLQLDVGKADEQVKNAILESVIQILLAEESRNEHLGPYVPEFYEIAYDPLQNVLMLRMERLKATLGSLYAGSTPAENDSIVPSSLVNLIQVLTFFQTRFQMNHRDVKSNNVMYVVGPNNEIVVKLIDFGFTCLTWHGLELKASSIYHPSDPCNLVSRDMNNIMYELYMYYARNGFFSHNLKKLMESCLTVRVQGKICKMYKGCPSLGLSKWPENYYFLNDKNVHNPNCEPKRLREILLKFMGMPSKTPSPLVSVSEIAKTRIRECLPEEILNPTTKRCVKRSSRIGKQLMKYAALSTAPPKVLRAPTIQLKPCGPGQARDPTTRRCRKVQPVKVSLSKQPCGPGQVRDPTTRRCRKVQAVKVSLSKQPCGPGQARDPTTRRCRKVVVPLSQRPCPPGKQRHPVTKRCKKI
jgi:serine/threonine protein kinase